MPEYARGSHRNEFDSWQSLRLFIYYRLALWVVLCAFFFISIRFNTLEIRSDDLYIGVLLTMIGINIVLIPLVREKYLAFRTFVGLNVLLDIGGLSLLIFISTSGISSGLPLLMVPTLAAGASLLPGRIGLAFAATATLAVLTVMYYIQLFFPSSTAHYNLAAIIGILFFMVASISIKIARRANESEEAILERDQNLASLAQMNEQVIDRMESGVIVVGDEDGRIRLLNQSAWRLMGDPVIQHPIALSEFSSDLYTSYSVWRKRMDNRPYQHGAANAHAPEYEARFVAIGSSTKSSTLIFLDDLGERGKRVQKEKLASLGRLSASIAHEIRNPLSAIRHSSQLLHEVEDLAEGDKRLVSIIDTQTKRINRIIEDILAISKPEATVIETFHLSTWLEKAIAEYRESFLQDGNQLELDFPKILERVAFDTNQLRQVLWNTLNNAQKHAKGGETGVAITVTGGFAGDARYANINIYDNGTGIDATEQKQLFEPFHTSSPSGTGLGLYISRELCINNGGSLEYIQQKNTGSCFRIKLPTV